MNLKSILGWIVYKVKNRCYILLHEYEKSQFASFGTGSTIDHHCVFTPSHIHIGNNVHIGPKCLIRSAHGTIVVGNHVMIGPGVHIHGGNHPINLGGGIFG